MQICVFGLWHLGCVTAACLAEHYPVIGLDLDNTTVDGLNRGRAPILEPGLEELIRTGLSSNRLRFTTDPASALADAQILWVTFDTPVDDEDRADAAFVEERIAAVFPHVRPGSTILISSQLPVGSTRRLETRYRELYAAAGVRFAYSPENLRLGKALEVFRNPFRIVVGVRCVDDRPLIEDLLAPFSSNLLWMSIESAEMTKHALNAFLATSIAFINEIAVICEEAGADAKQVERGLKSDERIGPRAYLAAGGPFAGGTLARDVEFLSLRAEQSRIPVPLLDSVKRSNDLHKSWQRRKLKSVCGTLSGKTVTVLGLTYKPGTDTLRRSLAVELCEWLSAHDVRVNVFDPAVHHLPEALRGTIRICASAQDALQNSDVLVVATEWPEFRSLTAADLIENMKTPVVVDANRFLESSLQPSPPLLYFAVGVPGEIS